MDTVLLKHIDLLATFDDAGTEIADGAVVMAGNRIERVGTTSELRDHPADRVLDMSGHIVMPGMVNTHHHMYQNLTRVMGQDDELFTWLRTLYPIWARLDDAAIDISTRVALAELVLTGCTTTSDHLYMLPNNARLDTQIEAARSMGVRFHAARGAMSRGESEGGLPPDNCVEREAAIIDDAARLIDQYHEVDRHAMTRLVLAPCSPFSVTPELLAEAARLARRHPGVRLHSHLAEEVDEEIYCQDVYGMRSAALMESVGWLEPDVWFAHAIFLNDDEIRRFAETGTGVAHCPSANMRCGQGIAKVRQMLDAGVPTALGVDGSASNDTSNLFMEARMAMMLQRVAPARYLSEAPGGRGGFGGSAAALSAREALCMATRGGARVLGRDDIGCLAPDMSADLIAVDTHQLAFAGTQRDPLAALVFCGPFNVNHSFINGRQVVADGELCIADVDELMARHAETMRRVYAGARAA